MHPSPSSIPRRRLALLAMGGAALVAGLGGALVLLGVTVPTPPVGFAAGHGVLMTLGFLGTVIALERAVALGRPWGYLAPLANGLGGLVTVVTAVTGVALPLPVGPALFAAGAAVYVAIYATFLRSEPSLHGAVQGLGAIAWFGGAALLLAGWTVAATTPWLIGFLVLTIAGERLELSRVLRPTPVARATFGASIGLLVVGILAATALPEPGVRVAGAGLLALAAWLLGNDIARRTVRGTGVTRFIGVCLLVGYAWMAVGGFSWLVSGPVTAGPAYDTVLHSLLLGFVISMVFGHAPVILPSVLRAPLPYHPSFYASVLLLHAGLVVRIIGGNGLGSGDAWRIGGTLNVLAMVFFVALTFGTSLEALLRERGRRRRAAQSARPGSEGPRSA